MPGRVTAVAGSRTGRFPGLIRAHQFDIAEVFYVTSIKAAKGVVERATATCLSDLALSWPQYTTPRALDSKNRFDYT